MNVVYCADRNVLPALHASAYSVLAKSASRLCIWVLGDTLTADEIASLRSTLDRVGKPYELRTESISPSLLSGFPTLNRSLAAYYRLFAPRVLDVEQFLYLDADTLCDLDVTELKYLRMNGAAAGWVPEAPLSRAVDRKVAEQLGNGETEPYFNSGVIWVNVPEWRRQKITERTFEYIKKHRPEFHDQSALNAVLHRNSFVLDERFNCMANMRRNWPHLKRGDGKINRLVHFIDYPKPWDALGRWVHPHFQLWNSVFRRTSLAESRTCSFSGLGGALSNRKRRNGYVKAMKDRLLFAAYSRDWFNRVRGIEESSNSCSAA